MRLDGSGVGHLRYPFGTGGTKLVGSRVRMCAVGDSPHKASGLDVPQTSGAQSLDQFDLGMCGDDALLVL